MSDSNDKTLFLLDGMALIYRAHFAFIRSPIINSKGFNTSALFGYANTLLDILNNRNPTHIAVAFDTSAPTQRHIDFPEYKAQREAMPEELSAAIPYIFKLTEAFNIPVLKKDGYEADDIIGTLSKQAEAEDFTVFMVTPDKDFAQLVSDKISLYRPGRAGSDVEILDPEAVCKKYELDRPEQVIDLLGMWGDTADNIPGIPGIGQKTGAKLLRQFGSLEQLLEHTDQLKGKQKEKVEANANQARLSKKLATIWTDVPVETTIEALTRKEYNEVALKELFVELEFNALGKKLFGDQFHAGRGKGAQMDLGFGDDSPDSASADGSPVLKTLETEKPDYQLITDSDSLNSWLGQQDLSKGLCFDTETTGLNPLDCRLLGVALCAQAKQACYVVISPGNHDDLLAALKPLLSDPATLKIGHNLKFDIAVLAQHGIAVKGPLFDTMIAHALVDPDQRHNMDYLAESLLGYKPISITELIGEKGKDQKSMEDIPLEQVAPYAAEDADITFQLRALLEKGLKDSGQEKVYSEVEAPLIPVLAAMEAEGVRIDPSALKAISSDLEGEIFELETAIRQLAGTDFNMNSPKQLGQILFDVLKLDPKAKKTKTGQYATNEQVLTRLAPQHEIVQKILELRAASKLKSTYVDALPHYISEKDGRVHTTFNQSVTATGRLNSTNPNIQNIPVRTERSRLIRKAFVPRDDDHLLLAADYSQIELRIMASVSGEEAMLEAFRKEQDIHSATAARIFGVELDDVISDMRRTAKMVNFGIIYGISAHGLGQRLGIPRGEAASIIEEYFNQYPKIKDFMDNTVQQAKDQGYVSTLLGRRRPLRDINSANGTVRMGAERVAINTPIQGTAADMIKIAMARVQNLLEEKQNRSRMLLQIHDELVFDLHKDEQDNLPSEIANVMQNALPLDVPIIVECGIGKDWLEAH